MTRARLKGGPFDGDRGRLTRETGVPDRLWAYRCERCLDVHWTPDGAFGNEIGAEPYDRSDEEDERGQGAVIYVYVDTTLDVDQLLADCSEPVAA